MKGVITAWEYAYDTYRNSRLAGCGPTVEVKVTLQMKHADLHQVQDLRHGYVELRPTPHTKKQKLDLAIQLLKEVFE